MHVLRCQCSDMVALRERVIAVTEECVRSWNNAPGIRAPGEAGRKRRRAKGTSTRRQVDAGRKGVLSMRDQHLQTETEEALGRATNERKVLVSLGSNWADLPTGLHARIIGEAAVHWAQVEPTYAAVNGVAI